MNASRLMIDPNKDVNEVRDRAGRQAERVDFGGGSSELTGRNRAVEVSGFRRAGTTTSSRSPTVNGVVCRARRHGGRQLGEVAPASCDTVVAIRFDDRLSALLRCRRSPNGHRERKELVHKRDRLVRPLAGRWRRDGRPE
jgi:hypothetical protein